MQADDLAPLDPLEDDLLHQRIEQHPVPLRAHQLEFGHEAVENELAPRMEGVTKGGSDGGSPDADE